MNRVKGALTAPVKDAPAYCNDCERWPAPVQWNSSVRLCEKCAAKRRGA